MEKEKEREKLDKALLKVALGFKVEEVTEEFAEVDGNLKLTKRKSTKKDVPPDLKAVQLLLGEFSEIGIEGMSDEDLQAEKERLLELLKVGENGAENCVQGGQVCVEKKKAVKKTVKKSTKKTVKKAKSVKTKKTED